MLKTMIWVINPTKFCNLRCAYCYEWDNLDDRARMSPELLRRVFEAVRDYHEDLETRYDRVITNVAWLGGEPLALPVEYLRDASRIQADVLGPRLGPQGAYRNVVQSNLYRLSEPVLDFLQERQWLPGISLDVVPGVRLSRAGQPTEGRVLANLARLRARGFDPEAICVLAKHTAPRICEVYDFFAQNGFRRVRVLPLSAGPAGRNAELFAAPQRQLIDALCELFVHWLRTGARVEVDPLAEYLRNVLRRRLGYRGQLYDRAVDGECILTVDPNGDVFSLLDVGDPARALGNLGRLPIRRILESAATQNSRARDAELRARVCEPCRYASFCNGGPAFEAVRDAGPGDRCPIAYDVHCFIDKCLDDLGVAGPTLGAMLRDVVSVRGKQALPVLDS